MKPLHIGICIPGSSMPMESVRCYGRMFLDILALPVPAVTVVSQHMYSGSILPYVRSKTIRAALDVGATHCLMLDSDMTYPRDTLRRLLAHDRPFVAANATTRHKPVEWCAGDGKGNKLQSHLKHGLEKADYVGLAVALIERRVFEALPPPLFDFSFGKDGWTGEDVTFSRRVREKGFAPMVDHDLSKEIGHVGTHEFTWQDIEESEGE